MDDTLAVPRQLTGTLLDTAVRYAEERHWEVLPGAWLEIPAGGVPRCCCGTPDCAAPGAHPTRPDWAGRALGSAASVRRAWAEQPLASVLLPTGRTFDALDVPETAGVLALARMERMGLPLGPVLRTPARRMAFFVLPGAAAKVPRALARLGWPAAGLDLVVRGEGGWVPAPPTRMATGGRVQWARQPTAANRWLPDAEELVSALAYACGRDPGRAGASQPARLPTRPAAPRGGAYAG